MQYDPGHDGAGCNHSRYRQSDESADPEELRREVDAHHCAPHGADAPSNCRRPEAQSTHHQLVDAANREADEHGSRELPTPLPRNQNLGARRALRVGELAMLLDDQILAERNHEEHAEQSADEREPEDSPELELVAEKEQRGHCVHYSGGDRLAGRADGLHDVLFENRLVTQSLEDGDCEDRDRNRGAEIQPDPERDVDRDQAEHDSEERSEKYRPKGELRSPFGHRDVVDVRVTPLARSERSTRPEPRTCARRRETK